MGQAVAVAPRVRTYQPSLKRAIGWGAPLLLLAGGVIVVVRPGTPWVVRLLGGVSLVIVIAYLTLIVLLRVETGERQVRVRRFVRWRTYAAGDDFAVERVKPLLGRPVDNLVVRSERNGLSRIPIGLFRDVDRESLARRLEAVLGPPGVASPRPRSSRRRRP